MLLTRGANSTLRTRVGRLVSAATRSDGPNVVVVGGGVAGVSVNSNINKWVVLFRLQCQGGLSWQEASYLRMDWLYFLCMHQSLHLSVSPRIIAPLTADIGASDSG